MTTTSLLELLATEAATATTSAARCCQCRRTVLHGVRYALVVPDGRAAHLPCIGQTVEQDEGGVWCAHAWLGSSGGANGNGATRDEAVADLLEAAGMVLDEDGVPAQLAQTLDLEVA